MLCLSYDQLANTPSLLPQLLNVYRASGDDVETSEVSPSCVDKCGGRGFRGPATLVQPIQHQQAGLGVSGPG